MRGGREPGHSAASTASVNAIYGSTPKVDGGGGGTAEADVAGVDGDDAVRLLHDDDGCHNSSDATFDGIAGNGGGGGGVGCLETRAGNLWGHPRGLYVLCATELWERYSYYAMRALLILFMKDVLLARGSWTRVFGMPTLASLCGAPDDDADDATRDKQVLALASRVYGMYTAFVYFTPLFGGYLADGYFGTHAMIVAGAGAPHSPPTSWLVRWFVIDTCFFF